MHFNPAPSATPPFTLRTDPARAIAHESWAGARREAVAALTCGGAACLVGAPGTGKSLLLQAIAAGGIPGSPLPFLANTAAGRAAAMLDWTGPGGLILDEADTLDDAALQRLATHARPLLIAGLPGMEPRLAGTGVEIIRLAALRPLEVARVVAMRLDATGRPRDLFDPEAVLALAAHSGGLMRLVVTLAGSALFLAEQEPTSGDAPLRVMARHVEEAVAMRDGLTLAPDPPPPAFPAAPLLTALDPGLAPAPAPGPTPGPTPGPAPDPAPPTQAPAPLPTPDEAPSNDDGQHPATPAPRRSRRPEAVAAFLVAAAGAMALGWTMAGSVPTQTAARQTPVPSIAAREPSPVVSPPVPQTLAQPPPGDAIPLEAAPVPAPPPPPPPTKQAVRPLPQASAQEVAAYHGVVVNDTLGTTGRLTLGLRPVEPEGAIRVRFQASAGLLGTGELAGTISQDGRLTVSGPLAVGANTFFCRIEAIVTPDTLSGGATYSRPGSPVSTGRFRLTRG